MKYLLILCVSFSSYGQQLHHQMLSSQASSSRLGSGLVVNQTIGQQSVIGNHTVSNATLGQGFQQSKLGAFKTLINTNQVTTKVYPNPFVDQIHFQFSEPVTGLLSINIFDMLGRLIFSDSKVAVNSVLSLENLHFAENEYLIQLSSPQYTFSTQIIKTK